MNKEKTTDNMDNRIDNSIDNASAYAGKLWESHKKESHALELYKFWRVASWVIISVVALCGVVRAAYERSGLAFLATIVIVAGGIFTRWLVLAVLENFVANIETRDILAGKISKSIEDNILQCDESAEENVETEAEKNRKYWPRFPYTYNPNDVMDGCDAGDEKNKETE